MLKLFFGRLSSLEVVMHKAGAFFFCMGLFLLALTYYPGAPSAGAQQAGNPIVAMAPEGTGWVIAIAPNGETYRTTNSVPSRTYDWELVGNVSNGSGNPIMAVTREGYGAMLAVAANGDMYRTTNSVPSRTYGWELVGNLPSGAGNPIMAIAPEGTGWVIAVAANGDTYRSTNVVPSRTYGWELVGSMSGAVSAQATSFGQVKAKYATPASGK